MNPHILLRFCDDQSLTHSISLFAVAAFFQHWKKSSQTKAIKELSRFARENLSTLIPEREFYTARNLLFSWKGKLLPKSFFSNTSLAFFVLRNTKGGKTVPVAAIIAIIGYIGTGARYTDNQAKGTHTFNSKLQELKSLGYDLERYVDSKKKNMFDIRAITNNINNTVNKIFNGSVGISSFGKENIEPIRQYIFSFKLFLMEIQLRDKKTFSLHGSGLEEYSKVITQEFPITFLSQALFILGIRKPHITPPKKIPRILETPSKKPQIIQGNQPSRGDRRNRNPSRLKQINHHKA